MRDLLEILVFIHDHLILLYFGGHSMFKRSSSKRSTEYIYLAQSTAQQNREFTIQKGPPLLLHNSSRP